MSYLLFIYIHAGTLFTDAPVCFQGKLANFYFSLFQLAFDDVTLLLCDCGLFNES